MEKKTQKGSDLDILTAYLPQSIPPCHYRRKATVQIYWNLQSSTQEIPRQGNKDKETYICTYHL